MVAEQSSFHNQKPGIYWVGWACGVTLLSILLKLFLLAQDVFPFNADEAVVGLMARHILQGDRPVFFYGQAYMGSLDAWLVSFGFGLFGERVEIIRLVQVLLYAVTVLSAVILGWMLWNDRRIGILAGLFLSIPNVNVTLYTTVSLGGYGEALLIGNLILITTVYILRESQKANPRWVRWGLRLLLGFWIGLGLWVHGITLVYSVPAVITLVWFSRPQKRVWGWLLGLGVGFILGAWPWWYYALTQGWRPLVDELLGSAVAVEDGPWFARVFQHAFNLVVLGTTVILGFRPPWSVKWLVMPLMPMVLSFWLLVIGDSLRRWVKDRKITPARLLLVGIVITLVAGFLFTSFGVDPSGRYFLPLILPMAYGAAQWVYSLRRKVLGIAWAGLILVYHFGGILTCAAVNPPGITTQFYAPAQVDQRYLPDLAAFLEQVGETRGYSNYWVAYPLAFISKERLIFSPRLPYHPDLRYTTRDDRYPVYTSMVEVSDRTAYITTRNPALDEHLKQAFSRLGVSYQEVQIGDYHVYYRLSRPVHPREIGLGETRQ